MVEERYEYIHVTFPLNPLSQKGDLPSLRSKHYLLFFYFMFIVPDLGGSVATVVANSLKFKDLACVYPLFSRDNQPRSY